jgi:hypothetical protein
VECPRWGLFIGTGGYLLELGALYWNWGALSGMTGTKVAPPSALWAGARKTWSLVISMAWQASCWEFGRHPQPITSGGCSPYLSDLSLGTGGSLLGWQVRRLRRHLSKLGKFFLPVSHCFCFIYVFYLYSWCIYKLRHPLTILFPPYQERWVSTSIFMSSLLTLSPHSSETRLMHRFSLYFFHLFLFLRCGGEDGGTVRHCLTCLVGIEVTQLATVSRIPHHNLSSFLYKLNY